MARGRKRGGKYLRETEKPKVEGWVAKRRLRMVDFPAPEGPEMTIGRRMSGTGGGFLISFWFFRFVRRKGEEPYERL